MEWAAKACWAILGLVHLMPALAFFRPALIGKLYRVSQDSPLFLLLHHRAALFVVIVMLCIGALLMPDLRRIAVICVGFSMVSFLFLYWLAGTPPALKGIAFADAVALPALAFAAWSAFSQQ